jgi:hypothetical protein
VSVASSEFLPEDIMALTRAIKTERLNVGAERCVVHYFEVETLRGGRRYTAEIVLASSDRIILDDDSLEPLESRVRRVAPATVYSRMLAARATAA